MIAQVQAETKLVDGLARRVLISTKLSPWLKRAWRGRLAERVEEASLKN